MRLFLISLTLVYRADFVKTRCGIKLVVRAEDGQGPAVGEARFTNVKVNNPGITAIYGENQSPNFHIIRGSGNNW